MKPSPITPGPLERENLADQGAGFSNPEPSDTSTGLATNYAARSQSKGSDLFVQALEAEGIKLIFGVPGEENLDFLHAVGSSNIQFIPTRHEQAAGFMAATYGRLTGKVGVCLATLGPGATNLITAAAYAQLGGMPLLMITGQKPIKSRKQGQFQILDVIDLMQPVTKKSTQISSASRIPMLIREAISLAQEERPGAVHLELPEDIAEEQTDALLIPESYARRPLAEPKALGRAVNELTRANSPLIVIGSAANRARVSHALRELIDKQGIPFITTQMGKGVVDESHPQFIGNAALSEADFVHSATACADVILNVGHEVVEKPPFLMDVEGPPRVIHVNFSPAGVDTIYFPQVELVGDIGDAIERLNQELLPQPHWNFERFHSVRDALETSQAELAEDDSFPLRLPRIVNDVRRILPREAILTLDNGLFKIWFARNFPAHEPNTVLLDNALASMGAGLPSAIGARFVESEKPVVAICGDGGLMMNAQELETAVRLKLDLIILVLRDDAYGMIRWKQQSDGFPDFGLKFGNPDFATFAEAHGAKGHRVDGPKAFASILESCLQVPGVHLIDVPVDYSHDATYFSETIPERIANMENIPCPAIS